MKQDKKDLFKKFNGETTKKKLFKDREVKPVKGEIKDVDKKRL
jgi:hypothetical protein